MPDKKLTDLEIVKALENALVTEYETIFCMGDDNKPQDIKVIDVLNLINHLKAENKSQSIMIKMLKGSIEDYKNSYINQKAEVERLNKEFETEKNQVIRLENQIERLLSMNQAKLDTIRDLQEENNWYNETLNTTKAEAYKEFAELIKKDFENPHIQKSGLDFVDFLKGIVDNRLKRTAGDDK